MNKWPRRITDRACSQRQIHILAIRAESSGTPPAFECLAVIDSSFKAMTLCGDLLAMSDDVNETHIVNWRTGALAALWGSNEPSEHNFQVSLFVHVIAYHFRS